LDVSLRVRLESETYRVFKRVARMLGTPMGQLARSALHRQLVEIVEAAILVAKDETAAASARLACAALIREMMEATLHLQVMSPAQLEVLRTHWRINQLRKKNPRRHRKSFVA
jgi:hypothetical protein